ncbi:MAG: DUF4340 domain-containing protein [Candidatus Krumholzibacteriia bacterium]
MLNRKNLIIVAVVLVALVAVSALQSTRHEAATGQASSQTLIEGDWTRTNLDRVTVGFGQDNEVVVLTAGDPDWRVASAWNARADANKIDTLLRTLSGLRGEFRSDSQDVLGDYGFADSTSIRIRGYADGGAEVFAIDVGNKPAGGRGNFVRRQGSDEVFLSTADVLGNLGLWSGPERPQSRHFLDLVAYRGDREAVDALRLEGDESLVLRKQYSMVEPAPDDTTGAGPQPDFKQWEWRLGDGTPVQKTKADGILGTAVNLRAQDVVDPAPGLAFYGLDPAKRTLTIEPREGDPVVIRFGLERPAEGKAPGGLYAQVGDDPTIWVVGTYNANNLFKARADLLPE